MSSDRTQLEEAALIRSYYKEAMAEVYNIYYESEEIAAHLALEIFRLENLKCVSGEEEAERLERLTEKWEILARTKENMRFILDRLHELASERDKFISDIYTSTKIVDIESRLSDLTPWLKDLSMEVQSRAETRSSTQRSHRRSPKPPTIIDQ